PGQDVQQPANENGRRVMMIKRAIDQIDADRAKRFLLPNVLLIEHAHVDENFGSFRSGVGLKADAEPAIAAFPPRRDGVGENEESGPSSALFRQSLAKQVVLIIEHRM